MNKTIIITTFIFLSIILTGCSNFSNKEKNLDHKNKQSIINFTQTGNIVQQNNNRTLIYDTPGSPATTKILSFETKPEINIGDRVYISGTIINNTVYVKDTIIIEKHIEEQFIQKLNTLKVDNFINDFESCKKAGYEIFYPDCIDCKSYCETLDGIQFQIP